jgi:hypothetical protein
MPVAIDPTSQVLRAVRQRNSKTAEARALEDGDLRGSPSSEAEAFLGAALRRTHEFFERRFPWLDNQGKTAIVRLFA